jgi:hypothetical protein
MLKQLAMFLTDLKIHFSAILNSTDNDFKLNLNDLKGKFKELLYKWHYCSG